MRVLLSDGAGLTGREVATLLHQSGHHVEVMASDPLALCRFTRHVAKLHRAPRYGDDPVGWLDSACELLARGHYDVMLPTQEQLAVLARWPERVRANGVRLAVPPFASLARVQDKATAVETLAVHEISQPEYAVAADASVLRGYVDLLPAFVKTAIGTASAGVTRVDTELDLGTVADEWERDGAFDHGPVVLQQAATGPLVMIQTVFDRGQLVAFHANQRVDDGYRGGAAGKASVVVPQAEVQAARLGAALEWHGALSFDAIVTGDGPLFIDVNPRLVEPVNAAYAGVDLTGALLDLSLGSSPRHQSVGTAGVRTHQLLQFLLVASEHGRGAVARELVDVVRGRGHYRESREELTPLAGDRRTILPIALVATALLLSPASASRFAAGAVGNYALAPAGWRKICEHPADG